MSNTNLSKPKAKRNKIELERIEANERREYETFLRLNKKYGKNV